MKLKCEYCDHYLADTDERCPNCGAPNPNLKRNAVKIPQTIEELKAFCEEHNLPLEKMHFHIGEDYKEPKAFGIYKDEKTENFVVYKNKADGSRAVRYEGKDEAYAVNEIYQKMKAEITEERAYVTAHGGGPSNKSNGVSTKKVKKIIGITLGVYLGIIVLTSIAIAFLGTDATGTGYYKYNDDLYYQRNGSWYIYDENASDWYSTTVDEELEENYDTYFESYNYDESYGGSDYTYSDSYQENYYDTDNNWDDDWDDDDWDYDSSWDSGWDSGFDTDWDTDW